MFPGRSGSFAGAIWTDAALTLTLYPLVFVAFVAITVVTSFASLSAVLPPVFALAGHHYFRCRHA